MGKEVTEEKLEISDKDRVDQQHDCMDVDEAVDNNQETDAPKNYECGEGMRDDPSTESEDDKSFRVKVRRTK